MIESGIEVKGERKEVARDSPMLEGRIYEFRYSVTSIPLPGFLEALRGWIMGAWAKLVAQFKGLDVLYWRLTDTEFVWQGRGISTSIWQEVALATVAIGLQGLFLICGVVMVLKTIFEVVETIPPIIPPIPPLDEVIKKGWPYLALGGLGLVALLFWPKKEKV